MKNIKDKAKARALKALSSLIEFKRSRVDSGLWGNGEGCLAIDNTLKAFGVKV